MRWAEECMLFLLQLLSAKSPAVGGKHRRAYTHANNLLVQVTEAVAFLTFLQPLLLAVAELLAATGVVSMHCTMPTTGCFGGTRLASHVPSSSRAGKHLQYYYYCFALLSRWCSMRLMTLPAASGVVTAPCAEDVVHQAADDVCRLTLTWQC